MYTPKTCAAKQRLPPLGRHIILVPKSYTAYWQATIKQGAELCLHNPPLTPAAPRSHSAQALHSLLARDAPLLGVRLHVHRPVSSLDEGHVQHAALVASTLKDDRVTC